MSSHFGSSHFGSRAVLAQNATLEAVRLRVASYKSPSLLGPTEASVCVRWIRRYLSYMSQSWCCAGCGTGNWGSRSSCHYCGQAPRTSNGNSWLQVAKKGKTSGKRKGVHTKQQHYATQAVNSPDAYANGEKLASMKQLHAQIAAVSNALTVFGCFRRQCIVATSRIPLDRFESQTAWNKADWTTSRWAAWSYFEVSETPCRSGDRQSGSRSYHYQRDRGHGELSNPTRRTRTTPHYIHGVSQSRRAEQWDARMGGEYSVINRQAQCWKAVLSTERLSLNHFLDWWYQHLLLHLQTHSRMEYRTTL